MTTPTTALTYNDYVTQVALLGVIAVNTVAGVVVPVDTWFGVALPQALNYAELRIQRDLNVLPAQQTNTYTLAAGANTLSIPVADFVAVRTVSANINSQMTALLPVSVEWLQTVYPSTSTPGPPAYFAMLGGDLATAGATSNIIQLGPVPDNNYAASIVGTVRLPTLNNYATAPQAGTATTWISTWLPDLLLMASLVYVSGYQRQFAATADQPEMGTNYEAQYQKLLNGATVEEARKQFSASAWSSMPPPVVASPSR